MKVASSTTICAAPPSTGAVADLSTRARRCSAAALRSSRIAVAASLASRTCSGSFAPGGTLSSARAARMPLTRRISQSISGPASGSSARASGIGHLARISG